MTAGEEAERSGGPFHVLSTTQNYSDAGGRRWRTGGGHGRKIMSDGIMTVSAALLKRELLSSFTSHGF